MIKYFTLFSFLTLVFSANAAQLVATAVTGAAGNPLIVGSGADGNVTVTGTIFLTQDVNYANLTISGAGQIQSNGHFIRWTGTLDLSAAGTCAINGNNNTGVNLITSAVGSSGGGYYGGPQPANGSYAIMAGAFLGYSGANGGTGIGAAASTPGTWNGGLFQIGGNPGAGGAGGASTLAGGASVAQTAGNFASPIFNTPIVGPVWLAQDGNGSLTNLVVSSAGVPGGSAGAGDGTNSGGGGGGGGAPPGAALLSGNIIQTGTNSTPSLVCSRGTTGGAGGNSSAGNTGGGGGGGGSNGGLIYLAYITRLGAAVTNGLDASGGNGGLGGNGFGTGKGGQGGFGGNSGNIQVLNLGAPSFSVTPFNGTTGITTPTTATTTTGTAGGLGATNKVTL